MHPNCRAANSFPILPSFKPHLMKNDNVLHPEQTKMSSSNYLFAVHRIWGQRGLLHSHLVLNNVNWQHCESGNTGNGIKAVVFHSGQKKFLFTCTQVDVILDGIKSCSLMLS